MKSKAQSIMEYVIVLGLIALALAAMSLYFRRGIQSVVKIAADEMGDQKDAEDINPITGTKTSSAIRRQAQSTQKLRAYEGAARSSEVSSTTLTTGTTASVSTQEK
ncbi:MAG: hypothetical protein PHO03_00225 [Candidatus Omnitrophica bacterium]|nr:hypothetical protein [Candidatus Omnitrophota bacterium]